MSAFYSHKFYRVIALLVFPFLSFLFILVFSACLASPQPLFYLGPYPCPVSLSLSLPLKASQFFCLPLYLFVSPRPSLPLSHVPTLAWPHRSLTAAPKHPQPRAFTPRPQPVTKTDELPSPTRQLVTGPDVSLRPRHLRGPSMHGALTRVANAMRHAADD